jgi:hypothetical protein
VADPVLPVPAIEALPVRERAAAYLAVHDALLVRLQDDEDEPRG